VRAEHILISLALLSMFALALGILFNAFAGVLGIT
jgi:hypothetical protein